MAQGLAAGPAVEAAARAASHRLPQGLQRPQGLLPLLAPPLLAPPLLLRAPGLRVWRLAEEQLAAALVEARPLAQAQRLQQPREQAAQPVTSWEEAPEC